jgi:membrane fusion protein, multidrug efflux system
MVQLKGARLATRAAVLCIAIGLLSGMAWIVRGRAIKDDATATDVVESLPVRLHQIQKGRTEQLRSLTGLVESRYVSELAFRVGGKIESRLVNVGDRVTAGQPLFKLELVDYELQLESAEADLASALATLKQASSDEARLRSLRSTGSVSADEYDKSLAARDVATARRTSAERALELARNRLAYTTLAAPADGVVTALMAERGQVVAEGRSVARLTQGNELEIVVGVPEKYVVGLKDSAAQISFWSLPGVITQGQLRELSPTADPVTRTYEARFSIINAPQQLQLGMSATLHLASLIDQDAISIPASALVSRQQRFVQVDSGPVETPFVWKVVDDAGHIEAVPVDVISYGESEVIVCGELSSGDLIVSAGVQKLDSDMTVQRWEELK